MMMYFFSQKAATLKAFEKETNYEQLQNTKTIDSKESQNKNAPGCFFNKEKESQKVKQQEDTSNKVNQNMAIERSLDSSCNSQKQFLQVITKIINQNRKRTKNLYVMGDSMVKHLNGWELSKKLNPN